MPAVREIALLTNPAAGRGRAVRVRAAALPRLRRSGLVVRDLVGRDPEDAAQLARRAVADGVEAVVVCGGDGSVHLAVQVLAGTGVALGLLPSGTGNDLARYLDLPPDDPEAAADRIVAGRTRSIDLARAGDRWFVTVLAAGFDAVVNERANAMTRPRGRARYTLATLAALRTFRALPYLVEVDGTTIRTDAALVAVGNGPSYGGGLRIAEGADLHDGLLDVVLIGPLSRRALVRAYPRLFRGTHTEMPEFARYRAHRVTVASPGVTAYADGERFGRLPLTVEAVPDALRVVA